MSTISDSPLGHIPVMKDEVLEFLALRYPGKFLDMTFGGGGHSRAILEANAANKVVAVDCDPEAATRAQRLQADFGKRFEFVDAAFDEVVRDEKFDGILFDLGVSSFQLDTPERGFSFRADAPADMRMDPRRGTPVWQWLQTASAEALTEALRDWAEEPRWRQITQALIAARGKPELKTTLGLATLVEKYVPRRGKLHPATKTFMGLRMAVNEETLRLSKALPQAWAMLEKDGILAVISFHSVEDRIVKHWTQSVTRPKDSAPGKLLLKRVGKPQWSERKQNARARSAKLRVVQKTLQIRTPYAKKP